MIQAKQDSAGPLEGVKLLDVTEGGGLYEGKVLADLDADVILVESPGGSHAHSLASFKDD